MALHQCADCGLTHDHPGEGGPVNPEVEIARIQADRDVKVAQLQHRDELAYNETRVEVAGIEADAQVDTAAVQAEAIAEIVAAEGEADVEQTDTGPEPVIVEAAPEPGPDAPPPPESPMPSPSPGKKSLWPYA
jgi:hypothetical protein